MLFLREVHNPVFRIFSAPRTDLAGRSIILPLVHRRGYAIGSSSVAKHTRIIIVDRKRDDDDNSGHYYRTAHTRSFLMRDNALFIGYHKLYKSQTPWDKDRAPKELGLKEKWQESI